MATTLVMAGATATAGTATTFWENLRFNLHFMHGVNCNNAIELCKAHKGCMSGPSRHASFVVVHMS